MSHSTCNCISSAANASTFCHLQSPRTVQCTHTHTTCTHYHDREKYIQYYFINFYRLGVRCRVQTLRVVVARGHAHEHIEYVLWQCGLNRAQYRIERLKSFSNENE